MTEATTSPREPSDGSAADTQPPGADLVDGGSYGQIPRYLSYAGALAADMGDWMPHVDELEALSPAYMRMGKEVARLVDLEVAKVRAAEARR